METREHIGYFEEFLLLREGTWPKVLGSRDHPVNLPADQTGRKLGHAGLREFIITEPLALRKGCNHVVVKASPKRPLRVQTMLQRMEGRIIKPERQSKARPSRKMTTEEQEARSLEDSAAILGCKPSEVKDRIRDIQHKQS